MRKKQWASLVEEGWSESFYRGLRIRENYPVKQLSAIPMGCLGKTQSRFSWNSGFHQ